MKKTFEELYDDVANEVEKRKRAYFLNMPHLSWEDVKQQILSHINSKWSQWDQSRPIEPWIYRIATNQIANIVRNNYTSFARPCTLCPFAQKAEDGNLCAITDSGEQSVECPLFAKWFKSKGDAHSVKLPSNIDDIPEDITPPAEQRIDYEKSMSNLREYMRRELKPRFFDLYVNLYETKKTEEQCAAELGYKGGSQEAGCKQIKNWKRRFKEMAKKAIAEEDIVA